MVRAPDAVKVSFEGLKRILGCFDVARCKRDLQSLKVLSGLRVLVEELRCFPVPLAVLQVIDKRGGRVLGRRNVSRLKRICQAFEILHSLAETTESYSVARITNRRNG